MADMTFAGPQNFARSDPRLERVQKLADLLDTRFRVPGTNMRFGLDGLLGLIPGIGDTAALGLSLWIVAEAWQMGLPRSVLARMLLNVALDYLVGLIPLLGDWFDFAYKANRRNADLMLRHLARAGR